MLQPEVFMRKSANGKGIEKHLRRIQEYNPDTGVIGVLKLTKSSAIIINQYDTATTEYRSTNTSYPTAALL